MQANVHRVGIGARRQYLSYKVNGLHSIKYVMLEFYKVANFNIEGVLRALHRTYSMPEKLLAVNLLFENKV